MAATGLPAKSLADLPPELIKQIISYAPDAHFVRNLSLSCKWLHNAVESNGWAAFVAHRFPSIQTPPYWRDAAHALTTLTKNIDIRACIVEDLTANPADSPIIVRQLPSGKLSKPSRQRSRQTMGYQPVIDSHEEWLGSWDARKEVLVWGAGADVMARVLERRGSVKHPFTALADEEKRSNVRYDPTGSTSRVWLSYRDSDTREGRDDVTSINLLRPRQCQDYPHPAETGQKPNIDVVVGRASKKLDLVRMWLHGARRLRSYDTEGCTVRGADVSLTDRPLLGACLGDSRVALYPVHGEGEQVKLTSDALCEADQSDKSRFWSARFLCPDKLAIGRGIARRIVYVYSVRPEGLSKEPIRAFSAQGDDQQPVQTSAYPIVSVPESLGYPEELGTLFISGGHDGLARLHDMRAANDCVGYLTDNLELSAIFSMAMIGRERLITGSQRHSTLKIFDLRMAGGRSYPSFKVSTGAMDEISAMPEMEQQKRQFPQYPDDNGHDDPPLLSTTQCNLWMNRTRAIDSRLNSGSPVYSLSRPSASSTSVYVGLENQVGHVNFTDPRDQYPDPVFRQSVVRREDGGVDSARTYGRPGTKAVNLLSHTSEGANYLRQQLHLHQQGHKLYTVSGFNETRRYQWTR